MDTIKLTFELIHSAGSYGGHAFNRTQLELLSSWPPVRGWVGQLIGKEIPVSTWQQVLKLKGVRGIKKQKQVLIGEQVGLLL
jgi:hypothetical protein